MKYTLTEALAVISLHFSHLHSKAVSGIKYESGNLDTFLVSTWIGETFFIDLSNKTCKIVDQ